MVNETLFYAFWNNKKIEIEGKDLLDAKQKAMAQLKIPKSKWGLLSVVSAKSYGDKDFMFDSVNNSSNKLKHLQTFEEFLNESKIVPENKIKVGDKGKDYIDEPGTIVYITDDIDDTKLHKYDSNGIISQIGSDIKDGAIDKNSTFVAVKLNDGDTTIYVYGEEGFKVTK